MGGLKIPYALIPAVSATQRREHVKSAVARGLPRLQRCLHEQPGPLYVACYGPSLRHTFEALRGQRPIMAMSGATKWLAARGIVADYAIECDPRSSQLTVSLPPVPGVHYLVASCVVPAYFDLLQQAGNPVTLWHTVNTNWDEECAFIAEADPDELVVHSGSTVGLAALQVGGVLGFRRFEIHGMDGSFEETPEDGWIRHAGHHGGKEQPADITWDAGGRTYRTSRIMANAVAETVNTARQYPIVTIWHGDGLTQALIREADLLNACCADETDKRARLAAVRPQIVQTPPMPLKRKATVWEALLQFLIPSDLPELVQNIAQCEPRRRRARYNTGTIPFESAAYLRAICRFYQPDVVVEVGTFIGTSTLALSPARVVYTCDVHNDCLPGTEAIITHPYQTSTQMLAEIQEPVDLFFFDGRLQVEDLPHIQRLSKPGTVYVTDDYAPGQKGVANVERLAALIPSHTLLTSPPDGVSTLAAMVPFLRRTA